MSNSLKTSSDSVECGSSSNDGEALDLENADHSIVDGGSQRARITGDYLRVNQSGHVGGDFK